MYKILSCLWPFLLLSSTAWTQTASTDVYFIGHSLCSVDMPKMLSDLAADGGHAYSYDYQLIWGACLSEQWDHSANPSVGSNSRQELVTGNYDILIMMERIPLSEVFIGGDAWGCDYDSEEVAGWFYQLAKQANPNLKGMVIEPWNEFNRLHPDYPQNWVDSNAVQAPLFQQALDSIAADYPQYDRPCLIPLRQSMEALVDSILAGQVPGLNSMLDIFDMDDDPQFTFHVNAIGHYFSALVHYAAIFGQSPVGLTHQTYDEDGVLYPGPSPAMALKMQEIVWEVVSGTGACTGITDLAGARPQEAQIVPHPHQGHFAVEAAEPIRVVEVWDLLGKRLDRREGQGSLRVEWHPQGGTELAPGTYILRLQTSSGWSQQKMIVQ